MDFLFRGTNHANGGASAQLMIGRRGFLWNPKSRTPVDSWRLNSDWELQVKIHPGSRCFLLLSSVWVSHQKNCALKSSPSNELRGLSRGLDTSLVASDKKKYGLGDVNCFSSVCVSTRISFLNWS